MPDTHSSMDEAVPVNPAGVAGEVRSTPAPIDDDALRDPRGKRVTPSNTREERRAKRLGDAAGHVTLSQWLANRVVEWRAKAEGLRAWLDASEPQRVITQDAHALLAQASINASAIPCSTLDPKRKFLSTAPKPGFVLGDTAVMAVVLFRSGAPVWFAMFAGLSMALSTVMVGSQLGQMMALAAQRLARGPAPEHCPHEHVHLYDDGNARTDLGRWIGLGVGTAGTLLVALTLIGVGQGDPVPLAFGFGLLAALTMGGAAGAEAYGTNAAAELRRELASERDTAAVKLEGFDQQTYAAAHAAQSADTLLTAAEHEAAAAAITVEAIADRAPDNPNIFGYPHPDSPTPSSPITPRDLPTLTPTAPAQPQPPRTIHRLTNPFTTPAPRSAHGTKAPR